MTASAYTELRRQAPRLALALLFQPEAKKQHLSVLLLFGLELDRIAAQASEPMLALIRLKWWEDQLEDATDEAGPLSRYLHEQLKQGQLSQSDIAGLITCWSETVQAGQTDMSGNWAKLVVLMARVAGLQASQLTQEIGRAVALSRAGQPVGALAPAKQIYQQCGAESEFLICLAYLASEAAKRDLDQAPFLIFGLVRQVLFRPASR